ncbi:thymidylate synthase [Devosia sp. UYZn731]|uniref:thymidylate synthase n=1 Tax=Devosia sp. UYZn731 TaxID=3156345 RepID=UPI0033963854
MFHHSSTNLDDLMRVVFTRLLSGTRINNRVRSRKGDSTEAFGALLELKNPRARLSRSKSRSRVFSPLGELLWYLSASNDLEQIQYYISGYEEFSDDEKTLNGAYGPRIFSPARAQGAESSDDQWQRVIKTLREREGSRNAIIQIYANSDGEKGSKDIPCTCTLHFVIRNKMLHLHVHMRSNDVVLGFPHDIFAFTMMQEIAARELELEVGRYQHSVGSLHLYDDSEDIPAKTMAQAFIDEGIHDIVPMPPMPKGNPWPAIVVVLEAERLLRAGKLDYTPPSDLDPYWKDLVLLLRAFAIGRHDPAADMNELLNEISFEGFKLYILDRIAKKPAPKSGTMEMFEKVNDGHD